jgi:hypothetical protein
MNIEELIEKLRQPAFDINEAQSLMEKAAENLERKHHLIQFMQANNSRLLEQVHALSLDLGLKEGGFSGEVKNQ